MLSKLWRERNPHTLLVGKCFCAVIIEYSIEIPVKIKNRTTIWPSYPTSVYLIQRKCTQFWKDTYTPIYSLQGFPGGSVVKKQPANSGDVQETQVQPLEWEDPLEKEMATHSSILAWEIPWREKSGCLQSMGSQKSQMWLSNAATIK